MNLTHITVVGNVAQEPKLRQTGDGTPVTSFRVASTPRVNKGGEWVDGAATFLTVNCWRALAENVTDSLRRGDPVLVHGRLTQRNFQTPDGQPRVSYEVEAIAVGHDLTRGHANFHRNRRSEQVAVSTAEEPAQVEVADEEAARAGDVDEVTAEEASLV